MILHKYLWTVDRSKELKNAPIQFRVKWDNSKKIATFSPGFSVDADKWSQDAQRCKANTTHTDQSIPANAINRRIEDYESYADSTFAFFDERNIIPSVKDFKEHFNNLRGVKTKSSQYKSLSIYPILDEFINRKGVENSWAQNTYKSMRGMRNCLYAFNPNLMIGDISDTMLLRLHNYLIDNKYKNTYLRKLYKALKEALNWMLDNGYMQNDSFKNFNPRLKGVDDVRALIYLTWDELTRLYKMRFSEPCLERAKDVFCFSCFTSLRFSDVAKLQKCDVKDDYIEVVTEKTSDSLRIDLNDYSRAILDKYKDETFKDGLALPAFANPVINRYIKRIAKDAGIDTPVRIVFYSGSTRHEQVFKKYEVLSMHSGRHTFIVNAIYLGIPPEVIMRWTGHSDYKSMKPYIAIADDMKSREMQKFNVGRSQ